MRMAWLVLIPTTACTFGPVAQAVVTQGDTSEGSDTASGDAGSSSSSSDATTEALTGSIDGGTESSGSTGAIASTGDPGSSSGASSGESDGASSDTGRPLTCDSDGVACDENATCDDRSGTAVCTCNPGWTGDGMRCEVDAAFDLLRYEVPCAGNGPGCTDDDFCITPNVVDDEATLAGTEGVTYELTVRVRGVVSEKSYAGGVADGSWYIGGAPLPSTYSYAQLTVSEPPQVYFLNNGTLQDQCIGLDYQRTITATTGATLTITHGDTNSCSAINQDDDGDPIVIPEIPPAPDPFDGQFVQIDLVGALPLPGG
jgi:hypothetical protein